MAQHGRAYSEAEDSERRLTPEGVAETERVAKLLAASGVRLSAVFHSGRARARQTAEIFARFLGGSVAEAEGLGPNDSPSLWASRAGGLSGGVMLVGHLPHLSRLLSLLVVGDPDVEVVRFVYSGVVGLEPSGGGGRWRVVWYVTPNITPP